MSETVQPVCPVCGGEPADVSWSTAPNQAVCSDDETECPVVTWDVTKEYEG